MFNADFLANIIVWRWINKAVANVVTVVVFVIGFAVYAAWQGIFAPLGIVAFLGLLVFLAIRHALRRQARLHVWRDPQRPWSQPPSGGRTEPQLYPAAVTTPSGLRAVPEARWRVSR